ncbi:MAG: DotU family type IV/VI secretion system protein [Pirellulaceae bacterium]|nr:DotU family type IV/VI secretion system protein [Planctomycetales bacterium]
MTPKLAQAVDPIFIHVLDLLEKIKGDAQPSPQEERLRVRALIDQAEAIVGGGPEWELSKYALVSWIDEMLVDTPWNGREWWANNVMEVELFNTRACSEEFFLKAQQASALSNRDALEVFYVCVVLGFRGMYHDPISAEMIAVPHGLPTDLETWAKQISMSIRLGQGRPPLPSASHEIGGAPPLRARKLVIWPWAAAVLLLAGNVVAYWFRFSLGG